MLKPLTWCSLALAAALSLSACGSQLGAARLAKPSANGQIGARSLNQLASYPDVVATWAMRMMDLNGDGLVMEAEAQTCGLPEETFNLIDMSVSHEVVDGHLVQQEMMVFLRDAEGGGLDVASLRAKLAVAYSQADVTKDGMLQASEALGSGVVPAPMTGAFKVNVPVQRVTAQDVAAADYTRDGVLTRAEFEDLFVITARRALGGSRTAMQPQAPVVPAPAAPVAPVAPPAAAPGGAPATASSR